MLEHPVEHRILDAGILLSSHKYFVRKGKKLRIVNMGIIWHSFLTNSEFYEMLKTLRREVQVQFLHNLECCNSSNPNWKKILSELKMSQLKI